MKKIDREHEYRNVRDQARRLMFLRRAGKYHRIGNAWTRSLERGAASARGG